MPLSSLPASFVSGGRRVQASCIWRRHSVKTTKWCAAKRASQDRCPCCDDGTFASDVTDFAGTSVLDASPAVVSWLAQRDLLFEQSEHRHDYPHCWRCDRPLIYRAVRSWFVRVATLKEAMVAHNRQVNWVPDHIRDGRFGQWLENARDWAVSRNRFWGSPIPVWRCAACAQTAVIQSVSDLETRAGRAVPDLHRPYIDDVRFACERCDGTMVRVPEVLDCWFESGAMPFAQLHYPFEHAPEFAATFPADFIVEYVAQTRGWFYTLHVLAVGLFDGHAFKNAVCHGVLLGADGRKMSKRLQNYPDPMDVVGEHGSDPLRIALLSSPVVRGLDIRFNQDAVRDAARRFVLPLWNTVHYFTSYASLDGFEPTDPFGRTLTARSIPASRNRTPARGPRACDGAVRFRCGLRRHRSLR